MAYMTTWNTIKLAILALSALAATAALAEIQKSNELDKMACGAKIKHI
jgi:hypothetical protein